ncbi:MAG TPA: alpha/beta hydrolase [Myxococcota bacterium]|nr:alpha/beta hydrolase [Myxococcota bacterium]
MIESDFRLRAPDGTDVFVRRFEPDAGAPVRATVQILHGMGEHSARYARFARVLTAGGFAVFAADCRGHGKTAPSEAELGHFADRDGWTQVLADVRLVAARIEELHPGVPHALFGHSMGSFIALDALTQFGDSWNAAVLSGSSGGAGALGWALRVAARAETLRVGVRGRSPFLEKLLFGRFNDAFAPARTEFDWLSRDAAEVDKYVADPFCGFVLRAGSLGELAGALLRIQRRAVLANVPRKLPILLVGGELDPVGGRTGIVRLGTALRTAGVEHVAERIYTGARHEMLNETNRDEVERDVCAWLTSAATRGAN